MRREYQHGTSWCFWRWKEIVLKGRPYLTRLILFQCPWFSIMMHWFHSEDPHRDLHDHPVGFLSFVLRGSYVEEVFGYSIHSQTRFRHIRWLNLIRPMHAHRVVKVARKTLTICFAGPRVREWGFYTSKGWVPWKEYQFGE